MPKDETGRSTNQTKSEREIRLEMLLEIERDSSRRFLEYMSGRIEPDSLEEFAMEKIIACSTRIGDDAAVAARAGFDLCMAYFWRRAGLEELPYTFGNFIESASRGYVDYKTKQRGAAGANHAKRTNACELQQKVVKACGDKIRQGWKKTAVYFNIAATYGISYRTAQKWWLESHPKKIPRKTLACCAARPSTTSSCPNRRNSPASTWEHL